MHIRPATRADRARIDQVRHGVGENRLTEFDNIREEEVLWYMDFGIFLVAEDEGAIQGFACVNPQTGYVWALFVIDGAQGRGIGTALLDAALALAAEAGNRQAFLTTGAGTRAEGFYASRGWRSMGPNYQGDAVYRRFL
jgi:GNAT superfamily N-acetyltransferase